MPGNISVEDPFQRIQDLENRLKAKEKELIAAKEEVAEMQQGAPIAKPLVRILNSQQWPQHLQNHEIQRSMLDSLKEVGVFRVKGEQHCFIEASVRCRLH